MDRTGAMCALSLWVIQTMKAVPDSPVSRPGGQGYGADKAGNLPGSRCSPWGGGQNEVDLVRFNLFCFDSWLLLLCAKYLLCAKDLIVLWHGMQSTDRVQSASQ